MWAEHPLHASACSASPRCISVYLRIIFSILDRRGESAQHGTGQEQKFAMVFTPFSNVSLEMLCWDGIQDLWFLATIQALKEGVWILVAKSIDNFFSALIFMPDCKTPEWQSRRPLNTNWYRLHSRLAFPNNQTDSLSYRI